MIVTWRQGISLRNLFLVAIAARLIVLPIPPTLSNDVFRYLWDGFLVTEGINPFRLVPSDPALTALHDQVTFQRMDTPDYFSIYPPVSQLFFAVAGLGTQIGFDFGYYTLKILFAACELAALLLLSRFVSTKNLLLYAWNPVVILETWGQPHTESILLLTLVICFWAEQHSRPVLATAMLTLATWTKLWPVLLFPFLFRRIGWKASSILVAIGLTIILWLPFFEIVLVSNFKESLDLYVKSFEWNAGVYYALKWLTTTIAHLFGAHPDFETSKIIAPLLRWLMLGSVAWIYWKHREWELPRYFTVLTVLFTLSLAIIHPWYFLPIALAFAYSDDHEQVKWGWLWVAVWSSGTYLFYTHQLYWPFVAIGWAGWFIFELVKRSTLHPQFKELVRRE